MARERKTIDTYEIYVNYGDGFNKEPECVETGYYQFLNNKKAYLENCQGMIKTRTRRVSREEIPNVERIPYDEAKAKVEYLEGLLRKPGNAERHDRLTRRLDFAKAAVLRLEHLATT